MDDARASCLGIAVCGGIGPATFERMKSACGTIEKAFSAPENILSHILTPKQQDVFFPFRKSYSYAKTLAELRQHGVWVITIADEDYPKNIKNIKDPPLCLFGRGDRRRIHFESDRCIGVVGSRKPTEYGKEVARMCGRAYAENDYVVVSGLAYGIDSIAQQSAIEHNGRTIAVLGTNITTAYPSQNENLYRTIINKNGIVISEYPPGFVITKSAFVLRNRIIVGLSESLVVVEGGEHSGSLISAKYAAENGREVFAVPGHITSEMSVGPHILLRQGAHLLQYPLDIDGEKEITVPAPLYKSTTISDPENKIITLLSSMPATADYISRTTGEKPTTILSLLSTLEIRGLIKRGSDGSYIRM